MRASLRYDQMTGFMSVSRSNGAVIQTKKVSVDTLRSVGDADVNLLILEAMQYPGQIIKMPLFRQPQRRAA